MGEVGHFQRLRGEAPFALLNQPGAHLLRALTPANVADVCLTEEFLAEAKVEVEVARRMLADLAYRSEELRETLAEVGVLLATESSERRGGVRQHIEIALSSLKRVFGLGETLATTLIGLATRIAAKICAYTPTRSWLTGCWIVLKAASRSCGHERDNIHLGEYATVAI